MAVFKKNGEWWIDYYAHGRRYREKVGPSKQLAETALSKRKIEIIENKFLDIKRIKKVRFEEFADDYLERHSKVNNKGWKKADLTNINALNKYFKGKYLHEITPYLIEKFKGERLKEVSPARVNRLLACLKSIFNKANVWEIYKGDNPVKKVEMLAENNTRVRFLEKEDIAKLLTNCNKELRGLVIIALNTGMRLGELLGLKWRYIDIKRGNIILHETKNDERREIPINEQVKTALIRIRKHPQSEYVFCHKDGSQRKDYRASFFTALKKSGIKDFRFHDLRHTFASHMVMSGVDLNTVRELLGHKSMKMTLRYAHLSPNHKKRAVDILSRRMDTIWTPEQTEARDTVKLESVTI